MNTLRLWIVILPSLIVGCSTGKIPNVRFYAEIPFQDCPEGVYVETISKVRGIIPCAEWSKKRPFMVMIDPDGKKEIFTQWSKACRFSGSDCNVELKSVRDTVENLDRIAETILKP